MVFVLILTLVSLSTQPAQRGADDVLALQVTLDRAGFSPGVIDGRMGAQTRRAADAYRQRHGRNAEPSAEPLARYTITEPDMEGPFASGIPDDMMQKAQLPALAYESIEELLAERYHTSAEVLRRLNPGVTFAAGSEIQVPNVEPFIVPAPRLEPAPKASRPETGTAGRTGRTEPPPQSKPDVVVTVSRAQSALTVRDANDRLLFYAPVTTGSARDPLPLGEWKITGLQFSPEFRYNPELFWDADPSHAKATLKPGPNNPVGVVWIDLSKEHYGLHGTPEPAAIGRSESHGCVRLTNWDAMRLAGFVKPGTRVVFTQ